MGSPDKLGSRSTLQLSENYDSDIQNDTGGSYELGRVNTLTRDAIKLHFESAEYIAPGTLRFGDVILMCTYHPVYKGALRPYMFWRMVLFKDQQCPVFLVLLTFGGQGPRSTQTKWYREDISFSLSPGERESISPIHSIIFFSARPDEKIYGQFVKKKITNLPNLRITMDHFLECHPSLVHHLAEHTLSTYGQQATPKENLKEIEACLKQEASSECSVVRCEVIKKLLRIDKSGHCKPIPANQKPPKVRPNRMTCEIKNGRIDHFDPTDPLITQDWKTAAEEYRRRQSIGSLRTWW